MCEGWKVSQRDDRVGNSDQESENSDKDEEDHGGWRFERFRGVGVQDVGNWISVSERLVLRRMDR
jgi:hypothetical protein